jgi:hypothetical protein
MTWSKIVGNRRTVLYESNDNSVVCIYIHMYVYICAYMYFLSLYPIVTKYQRSMIIQPIFTKVHWISADYLCRWIRQDSMHGILTGKIAYLRQIKWPLQKIRRYLCNLKNIS